MPEGAYPYRLEPIARPGDVLRLDPLGEYREVDVFSIRPEIKAFATAIALTANGTDADNEATELSMPDGWLGQFRMLKPGADIPDGVTVTVDQGGEQSPMYTTKNARGSFDHSIGTIEGDDASGTNTATALETRLTELYVWQDDTTPYFTFEETAGGTPSIQNVRFSGYAYRLGKKLSSAPPGTTPVAVPIERVRV